MIDIKRLLLDKEKYETELSRWQSQFQLSQTNINRVAGALAYINQLIKEETKLTEETTEGKKL